MNFLGHAAVARYRSREPATHFGAMLPDFVGMVAAQTPEVTNAAIARGVALHHATDDAFHRLPAFLALAASGTRVLAGRGVRRGTALAVAHVGVEILLDCVLARDEATARDFLAAVAAGAPPTLRGAVEWSSATDAERYARLHGTLVVRGLAVADPDPTRVTERIARSLAHRPRLAVCEADRPAVTDWLGEALDPVQRASPGLIAALLDTLALAPLDPAPRSAHPHDAEAP